MSQLFQRYRDLFFAFSFLRDFLITVVLLIAALVAYALIPPWTAPVLDSNVTVILDAGGEAWLGTMRGRGASSQSVRSVAESREVSREGMS